jgi:histidyl-tRNA synthetase
MKFNRPRGTNDLLGEKMRLWGRVEEVLASVAKGYGYEEIRTPIFEMTDLFIRAVGESTDIVTKEMYTFADKKGRSLTLRPENTAPVMRAYLEHGLDRKGGISRLYYIGPMFRYDRPQAGRYRQFHQMGAEAIGTMNPSVDAELIEMSLHIYEILGYPPLEVRLNSVGCPVCRPGFTRILGESLMGLKGELCRNCKERAILNPLRIFDCKECTVVKEKLPVITDHLCDECSTHFERLRGILDGVGIAYTVDPLLVRGLDYYTKTAYEIQHPELGAQSALCGGGRYDGLAGECGSKAVPAVGFSLGIERLMETLPEYFLSAMHREAMDVYFAVIEESASAEILSIARKMRDSGLIVTVDFSGRSVKKQLKAASESGALFTVIVGPDEVERAEAAVKNMETGFQEAVSYERIIDYIKSAKKQRNGE